MKQIVLLRGINLGPNRRVAMPVLREALAVFEALPGANFTVNGAAPPANSALGSLSGELHVTPHWSVLAKFDGEFATGAQTYAGTGTVRYTW